MDETKNNEMDKYLESLPENVVDLVHDKVWPKRVDEIAAKYSLNDEQKSALQDITLFVLIGVEPPETFGASLETELGISQILVEQILADLDTRVFQYAFDFISKAKEINSAQGAADETATPVEVRTPFGVLNKQTEEVEVPPVILPMVERPDADVAGALRASIGNSVPLSARPVTPQAPDNLPGVVVERPDVSRSNLDMTNQPSATQDGRFVGSEFVQKPVAVPRFNAVSAPETAPAAAVSPKQNIIDTKLNSVTSATAPVAKPEVQNPPRYIDPYREPLE